MPEVTSPNGRSALADQALRQLFLDARSHNAWLPGELPESMLREIYDLARMGPTSTNMCPGRFVFVTTRDAKERLKPFLFETNVDKVFAASCTVIVARDTHFVDKVGDLFPGREFVAEFYRRNPEIYVETYKRNTTLQGAYLILAARSLGIDTGPMSGFDNAGVDKEFFPDGRWKSDFLINLGFGDDQNVWPRNPRLPFEDACQIL